MSISVSDFASVQGSDTAKAMFQASLDDLANDSAAEGQVEAAMSAAGYNQQGQSLLNINLLLGDGAGVDQYVKSTKTLTWDPGSALENIDSVNHQIHGVISSSMLLLHEFYHARDPYLRDSSFIKFSDDPFSEDFYYDDSDEKRDIQAINSIETDSTFSEVSRSQHAGAKWSSVHVNDVTAHVTSSGRWIVRTSSGNVDKGAASLTWGQSTTAPSSLVGSSASSLSAVNTSGSHAVGDPETPILVQLGEALWDFGKSLWDDLATTVTTILNCAAAVVAWVAAGFEAAFSAVAGFLNSFFSAIGSFLSSQGDATTSIVGENFSAASQDGFVGNLNPDDWDYQDNENQGYEPYGSYWTNDGGNTLYDDNLNEVYYYFFDHYEDLLGHWYDDNLDFIS